MKIVHIESGLGNQMLSYCEYIALKKVNPEDDIYIENIIYDLPECNDVICQWNGYELERIFDIKAPNIRTLFDDEIWKEIVAQIRNSQFWEHNWNYPVYFTNVFNQFGLNIKNMRGDFEEAGANLMTSESQSWKSRFRRTPIGYYLKFALNYLNRKKILASCDNVSNLFCASSESIFTGQRLSFKFVGNQIESIDEEIRKTFIFPEIQDKKNADFLKFLQSCESVAIHARRGDMLGYNSDCYRFGYFRRAVAFIRKHTIKPVFVFFCDPGSVDWCRKNEKIFGLDFRKDRVYFVDWNKGMESFRDMQLMAECKHQIITNSSFGWWAAYLNKNPNKITCSPGYTINTTHHF